MEHLGGSRNSRQISVTPDFHFVGLRGPKVYPMSTSVRNPFAQGTLVPSCSKHLDGSVAQLLSIRPDCASVVVVGRVSC